MLTQLLGRLPPSRAQELERTVARSFSDSEDRRRATTGDLQGLGGSSTRSDN